MTRDKHIEISYARSAQDVAAIAALYPTKSPVERGAMVRDSLIPELDAQRHRERLILLARCDDQVVGTVQIVWSNASEDPVLQAPGNAVIHHLRTHPDHEGKGIARQLMGFAEQLSADRGVTTLTLGVEPANERARAFYTRAGFSPFHRYTGSDGEPIMGLRKRVSGKRAAGS